MRWPNTNAKQRWRRFFASKLPGVAVLLCSVCTVSAAADLTINLANKSGAPLADAVVFISASGAAARPAVQKRAGVVVVQQKRVFEPFVTVVEKGKAIDFPNEDMMMHQFYFVLARQALRDQAIQGYAPRATGCSELAFCLPELSALQAQASLL